MEKFSALDLPLETGQARLELARALAPGTPAAAVAEARLALGTFQQLGAVRDADRAAELLRGLGAGGRAWPRGRGALTQRQTEVLALVAEGCTDAEIAERLYISRRTAEHHVAAYPLQARRAQPRRGRRPCAARATARPVGEWVVPPMPASVVPGQPREVSVAYRILYQVGFTPWEQVTRLPDVTERFRGLFEREEAGHEPPYGPALDLGCGSGFWAVELARRRVFPTRSGESRSTSTTRTTATRSASACAPTTSTTTRASGSVAA